MRIIRTTQALRTWRRRQDPLRGSIGLVPTMGALHAGHRALIQRARRTCGTVVVSIFVNPLQFGPAEDYRRYPRDLSRDLACCREENADLVFLPKADILYPRGFQTTVAVGMLSQRWEGEHRPTHFEGVTTVVTKLLNLVRPDRAFLGQKDYQQYCLIRQLVKDLDLDSRITLCPTVRDADGFALSSRNRYVTKTERQQALALYQALSAGKEAIARGTRRADSVEKKMARVLDAGHGLTVDYLACCDARTLEPLARLRGTVVLLGAIRVGGVRFIDNLIVRIR
ncbi:MAG: pantoate--beta-alanine ligase [Nitrospira sp. SB0672_bin_25]|nr:pantoate--beta-alanine ligase [Nitrospira sp. SB0666_bin_27]MYF24394.1 pantoate--beta-alanine ligase [Nitrospira sp. SB0678_bin_10]MYJ53372.1 pantoate--beta-alanine ligase [Nitrospira sp. SB0672_bin_25]